MNSDLSVLNVDVEMLEECKVNYGIAFPAIKQKGKSVKVLEDRANLVALMDHYNIKVRFDVFKRIPKVQGIASMVGDDENLLLSELKSLCGRHELPLRLVDNHLGTIAQMNPSNPPLDWLQSISRTKQTNPVYELVELLPVENKDWVKVAFYRWFIQACAAADTAKQTKNPQALPKFESVLVFIGSQGLGKTSFMRRLLQKELHTYFSDGLLLDLGNKDSRLSATANWLVELGELDATFRKSDIASIKSHLSKQVDEIRLPYARTETRWPRRTCYMASVNDTKFLHDATGNRRYFPVVALGSLKVPDDFDAVDLWAYAWSEYKNGAQWWLTPAEENMHLQALTAHESRPITELLLDTFNFDMPNRANFLTGKQVLERIGLRSDNRTHQTQLGIELSKLDIKKNPSRCYEMPPSRDGI